MPEVRRHRPIAINASKPIWSQWGAAMNETAAKPVIAAYPPPLIPSDVDLRERRGRRS
jgi:hypothetical protein